MSAPRQITAVRCPAIKGLPDDVVHLLHHCVVELVHIRRGIEDADRQVARASRAVFESCELLRRLAEQGA